MIDPRTPILVGGGQITDGNSRPSSERSRVAFCAEAARMALADARASIGAEALGRETDAVAVMEFFSDISPRFASPFGRSSNPPRSVAQRLGARPRRLLYSHSGGNMPQYLVNRFAEEIASGETELALVCRSEAQGRHGARRNRPGRDLLRRLWQGKARKRLHSWPPGRLRRSVRGHGAR